MQSLSFVYNNETPALQDISFRFAAGGKYAVAGGSGSGKSTLLKLLQGSNDGYRGSILYDGKELRTLRPDSLYDLLSVIQQDVFIFNSSVRDISPCSGISPRKVERVIRLAGLEGLVNARAQTALAVKTGTRCQAENGREFPSPAACCGKRRCCLWTKPRLPWIR